MSEKEKNKDVEENNNIFLFSILKSNLVLIVLGIIILSFGFHYFAPRFGILSPLDMRWRETSAPDVRIDTDDEDYPVEFVSDGYRFYDIVELENGELKFARWEWKYVVENVSDEVLSVEVSFLLLDEIGTTLDSDTEDTDLRGISPGEKEVIRGKSHLPLRHLRKVEDRSWQISVDR